MKLIISILSLFFVLASTVIAGVNKLAISDDGKYVISSNDNNHAYLYNLDNKSVKDLGNNYNPYSAYFVPNSDNYLLQKNNKEVIVSDTSQKQLKSFTPDFIANEQAINSSLDTWVGSIAWGDVYTYSIPKMKKKQIYISWYMAENKYNNYSSHNRPDDKLPNGSAMGSYFDFTFLGNKLIATPNNSLVVYDFDKHNWNKVNENSQATMHAIDPNGKFVYTMDNRGMGVEYNLSQQKATQFTDNTQNPANFAIDYLDKTKDPIPYIIKNKILIGKTSNFKFIDTNKIVSTLSGGSQPFLWLNLYNTDIKQQPLGDNFHFATMSLINYLPLVSDPMQFINGEYQDYKDPYPVTGGFNTMFDTSVQAHRLVVAQANGDGVMVYKYNPSDESLKLEWVGEPPKTEVKEEESKGWW